MKILITSDWYTPAVNGVVASILALRRQLEARGHEVRVLTLSGTVHTTCENGVYAVGSVDAGLIYPGARLRSFAVGQTVRRLVEWKPDVVHSQCEFSTFFLARHIARAVGAPLIHTYHTVYEDYTHYFSPSRRWGRLLARGFTRAILGSCDGVIAPTEKVRALLEGYGVKPPVTVIPTGIPLGRFAAPVSDAVLDGLRRRLGIPAENRILVYVGRLAKEKNLEELLECRAALGRAPVTLLLVGDGPARPALEERAAALGLAAPAAVFAGMAAPEEVPLYYRLGDVFVSASSSETQGLTYLEALAAGTPAVCRADPCLNGVIENGVNGWQYETGRERDEELNRLLTDEPLRPPFRRRRSARRCWPCMRPGGPPKRGGEVRYEQDRKGPERDAAALTGGVCRLPYAGHLDVARGAVYQPGAAEPVYGRHGALGRGGVCAVSGGAGGGAGAARRAGLPGRGGAVWPLAGLFVQLCGHLRGQHGSLCHCTQLRPAAAVPDVPGKPH